MNGSTLPPGWLNSPYYIGELSRLIFFSIENFRHMQYCYIILFILKSKINFQTFIYIFVFLPNFNIQIDISKNRKNGSTLLPLPYILFDNISSKSLIISHSDILHHLMSLFLTNQNLLKKLIFKI